MDKEDYVLIRRDEVINVILSTDLVSDSTANSLARRILKLATYRCNKSTPNITNINFITDNTKVQELVKSIKDHQDNLGFIITNEGTELNYKEE